jgi:transcriptional regulator with XRE-family HTH domain
VATRITNRKVGYMMQGWLATRLRVLRAEGGLTISQAAERAGVTRETLRDLELGRRTAHEPTLAKIARAYGVPVADLIEEPVPHIAGEPVLQGRAESPPAGHAAPEEEEREPEAPPGGARERLMNRPEVLEWLRGHGHMDVDEFLSWAEDLEFDISEDGLPEGIERGIRELREKHDELTDALSKSSVRKALFPARSTEGLAGKEWYRAAFEPGRLAWKLKAEIGREYWARERALVNYSARLFAEGKTEDYLLYGSREGEPAREHHRVLEEERRRALRETYAKASLVVG